MRRRFSREALLACALLSLAGCSTRETKQALAQSNTLAQQQKYDDANEVLIDALRAREAKLRANNPAPQDPAAADALTKKVEADPEILKMERAQLPLYLHLQRADLAAAVYADILAGHSGDRCLDDLLKDKDPKIRTSAARTLGLTASPDAINPLMETAKDSDSDVRSEAVAALGLIQNGRTVPPLLNALNDSYWLVRSDAADALGREKDLSAIGPLLDAVSDPDTNVASSAESALVALSQVKGATPAVFATHLTDANQHVVMISAICLAVMKDPRATPVLIKLASAPDVPTRLHAVKGLGETGDPSVIPTLRQTLHDPEVNVRGWSIIGLDNLKDSASVPALQAMSQDPNQTPRIREFAAGAVKHLTGLGDADASVVPPPCPGQVMQTIPLGSSDLQVTRLCYGGMRLSPSWEPEKVDATGIQRGIKMLENAVEAGFNFIDHADIYGGGLCERIHGRAMEQHPEWRDHLIVATKCGIRWADESKGVPHRYDFDGDYIRQSVDGSLKRLNLDRIDLYQLHRPDWLADPADIAAAFVDLQKAGKVRHFGVSNFRPAMLSALQAALPFPLVSNQVEIHFLRLDCFEDGTLDQCLEKKMTPLAWSPLAGGGLAAALDETAKPPDKVEAQAAAYRLRPVLAEVARQYGVTPLAILLAWQMRHPSHIIPILGTTRPDLMREAAKADTITLDRESWYKILLAARGKPLP